MDDKEKDLQKLSMEEFESKMAEVVSEGLTKNLDEAVSVKLDEKIKDLGLDKVDRKFGVAPEEVVGVSEEDQLKMNKKQRVSKFIKAVMLEDVATLKAMTEGTAADGGYLVPEEFSSEVLRIAEDYGVARSRCRVVPMTRDTQNWPTVSSSVSVTWPGEATAGTAAQPTLGTVQLLAKTAVGLTLLSNELLEDATPDVVTLLEELFAEALAGEEDNQLFNGTGSPFTGILQSGSVTATTMATGDTAFSNIDAGYLSDMIASVKTTTLPNPAFFMHRTVWNYVRKLQDTAGNYIYSPAAPNDVGVDGRIWNFPIVLNDKLPDSTASAISTNFVVFGDLKHVLFGDRKQITMATSDSATVGTTNTFESNMSAVRFSERISINIALPTALAVLKTAAA